MPDIAMQLDTSAARQVVVDALTSQTGLASWWTTTVEVAPGVVILLKHHVLDLGHLHLEGLSLAGPRHPLDEDRVQRGAGLLPEAHGLMARRVELTLGLLGLGGREEGTELHGEPRPGHDGRFPICRRPSEWCAGTKRRCAPTSSRW